MQTLQIAGGLDDALDDFSSHELAIPFVRAAAAKRRWPTRVLDSTVCCVCLLILSPAIIAVWIAIRRCAGPVNRSKVSQADAESLDHSTSADTTHSRTSPLVIVLKPERLRDHAYSEKSIAGTKPAIVTHATL